MNNSNMPAMPLNEDGSISTGLTKREHFAVLAMSGILSRCTWGPGDTAKLAIEYADAMLKELDIDR